ncbi:MAG: hypothetical protein C0403_02195 [Desulfobacterium sp.]|nr:hypothetical protein [Desulfobacterium sp.]
MIKKTILIVISVFMFSGITFAATQASFEGKIKGANCIVNKGVCPEERSDPRLALEREFVLVVPSGDYYFMPNISRSIKADFFNKPVRITGDLRGQIIHVSIIEEKINDTYLEVWNWKKIQQKLNRG